MKLLALAGLVAGFAAPQPGPLGPAEMAMANASFNMQYLMLQERLQLSRP